MKGWLLPNKGSLLEPYVSLTQAVSPTGTDSESVPIKLAVRRDGRMGIQLYKFYNTNSIIQYKRGCVKIGTPSENF